jgi:hypothetical protein
MVPLSPLRVDQWERLAALAVECLKELLRSGWVSRRSKLSSLDLEALAQELQDMLAPQVISPLLRVGSVAWAALADDLEDQTRSWRAIAARWASRGLPGGLQCHLWAQYTPYAGGAGLRLRKAVQARQAQGKAPRSFERRLIVRVRRVEAGWGVVGHDLEPAAVGDDDPLRIEVTG